MAGPGKLEKMLVLAFDDSKKAENGGPNDAVGKLEVLINPEAYTLDYKVKYSESGQGSGTSGKQLTYEHTEPEEMTFEFLFDSTGIIDGKPRASVADEVKDFKEMLVGYKGDGHEPWHIKLVWGKNFIFKGRATDLSITFKLFNSDGTPIRAVVKAKFTSSIEEGKRVAKDDKKSSDLTHVRKVKMGDTLPYLCFSIYGDPRYYLQVAEANGLGNFRKLLPGTNLVFPSIDKTGGAP